MAGIENLFAVNPALPKLQTKTMPDDSSTWTEFLTTCLRENFPETAMLPIAVEFQKKDEQNGTAIGALNVANDDATKTLHVPFVIKEFELSPLDVWLEPKTQAVHPLTNDTFKKQFFVQAPAEGLDARPADAAGNYFNDPSLWTTNYPPLQGRYSYASAGYPLLDVISDSLRESELEAFRNELRNQPELLIAFENNGHKELVTKLAALKGKTYGKGERGKPIDTNDFAASAVKLIPPGILSLKKEGPDKYSILQTADQLFDIMGSEGITGKECKDMLSKIVGKPWDSMHDVDQSGEKMLNAGMPPAEGVWLFDDIALGKEMPEAATDFAHYRVKTNDGVQIEGLVLPHVISFSGKKKPYKLFISPTHSSLQTSIAGVKEVSGNARHAELEKLDGRARTGQTGTFVMVHDGKAIATEPVTIKAVEEYGPMIAVTMDGVKIKISRGYASHVDAPVMASSGKPVPGAKKPKVEFLDVHGMIEQRPNEYVIPRHMCWLPMERFTDVSATVSEWMEKEAATHMTLDPTTVLHTGVMYVVKTAGEDTYELDARRAGMLLAAKGCPIAKVAQILKKAEAVGKAKVYGLRQLKKKADIIKEASASYARLESICSALRQNTVKLAAEIDQKATVDTLLGLNFLNPENLSKFVAYRPVFEKVCDYLAELTLASRLGLKDIQEAAPVLAVHKLQEVVEGLKRVEAGLKKPESRAA